MSKSRPLTSVRLPNRTTGTGVRALPLQTCEVTLWAFASFRLRGKIVNVAVAVPV